MEKAGPKAYDKIKALEVNLHQLQTVSLEIYKFDPSLNGEITKKINDHMKESILQAQNDLNLFFKLQLSTIIDYLYLRCNMQQYFDDLMSLRAEVKAALNDVLILEDLEDISFMGFMILISKLVIDKKVYGSLLHQQGIPLPIFFKTTNQFVYQPQLCDLILGAKEFQLVLNVGSVGARSKGKSLFIAKVMNKQLEYISNEFEHSFFLHTQPLLQPTSKKNQIKNIMLMDFNGSISTDNPPQVKKMIQITASISSVIIIHLMKQEVKEGILKSQAFLHLFGSRMPNVILFLKDEPLTVKSAPVNLHSQYQKDIPFKLFSSIQAYTLPFQKSASIEKFKNLFISAIPYISESIYTPSTSGLKLSLKSLNIEDKEKIKLFEKIQATVKPLEDKNFLKKNEACYICSVEQICKMNLKIKRNIANNVKQESQEIIRQEQIKQSSFKPSAFITQTMDLISCDIIGKQLYTQLLTKAKNTVIQPLKQKKRAYDNLKQNESKEIQQKLTNYDINLDDIVNQFVGSSCYSSKLSEGAKKAQMYYKKCYENMQPINIIDSNTLLFGNHNLRQFFESIKITFKDIFVVSIFGSQSSGKSTLLNYLFRSNFETSSGRCTMGVDISFCKIGQTLIVVLDTEGIMSAVARNDDFTLRIPTFVMMTSDLIIVTNKGQLNDTFLKLMKNCLTILDNIRKSQKEKVNKDTHKMLIALISMPMKNTGQTIVQDEFLTFLNQLADLQTTETIRYKDYIDLAPNDIFTLPSLSETKKSLDSQMQSTIVYSDDYGKATLGMRSWIKKLIDANITGKIRNLNSLKDVYQHLEFQWNLLYKTNNLQDYEANSEKNQEQILDNICKQKKNIETITQNIQKKYHQTFKEPYEKVDQDTLIKNLTQCEKISKQIFKSFLEKTAPKFIKQKIIDKYQQQFQAFHIIFVEQEIKNYKKIRNTKKDQEKKQNLKKIKTLKDKYLQTFKRKSQEGLISQQNSKKLIESFTKQLEEIPLRQNIDKDKFKTTYRTMFYKNIILKNTLYLGKMTVSSCLEVVQAIKDNQRSIDKFLKRQNNIKQAKLTKCYSDFRRQFENSQNSFKNELEDLMNCYQIETEIDIISKFNYFLDEIKRKILNLEAKVQNKLVVLEIQRVKQYLLGKAYQMTLQKIQAVQERQIAEQNNAFTEEIKKQIAYVQLKAKQMLENAKKDLLHTLESQTSSYFDYIRSRQEDLRKLMRDNLKNYYEKKLKPQYTPKKMLERALSLTLLCPQDEAPNSHAYYIDCYKFVINPKRFIGELLMNESFYRLKGLVIQQTIQKAIKEENDKILQRISSFKNINDSERFKKILQDCKMYSTSEKFAKQDFYSAGQLANKISQILSNKQDKAYKQLENALKKPQVTKELINISKDKFKHIFTWAVGCESRCLMCGMKCALESHGSAKPHATLSGCHSLISFGGCSLRRNNQILTVLCQSQATNKKWRIKSTIYNNCIEMIDKVSPQWKRDFPKFTQKYQPQTELMRKNIGQLKRIWENIELVMIQTKFHGLQHAENKEVKETDLKNHVTLLDLMNIKVVDPENHESEILLENY